MWISGIIIGTVLLLIAGVFKTVRDIIIMYPNKLKKWMKSDFWLYEGSLDRRPGKFRKYKNYRKEEGPAFFGSTTFLKFTTHSYHLFDFGHGVLLISGTVLFCIGFFFAATSLHWFIGYQLLAILIAHFIRVIGGWITTKICFNKKK